ncbi:nucleotidyltransferase domain-containing protein [Gilvimarinus xylanilyticus]|uniref:Nucleotidyltransferase domain-containing protein n=1 Tax=Gilvimarinus xylanilyticus TaxID=2944139 RepID=A0A9X2HXP9_9GAMM|nr:nucleotidyltransferase domain-containing protein [Gilvimarinus xylanilyticus]MCP8900303.1 nucleotidyltransferase domain-containing protein [Gilvimarinus xylanilyticus]
MTYMAKKDASIVALWLYGSRARGDFHPDSDYDLAVGFNDWLEAPLERRLRPELMAQQWRDSLGISESELSVVDISLVPIPLGLAILTDGQ